MRNQRDISLDFVRAIATILIVICHFNARYMFIGTDVAYKKMIIGINIFNIYIGSLGVSIFLIISGFSLMKVYQDKLDIKKFYIKRFFNIYPMFWIAYLAGYLHQFWKFKCINQSIPKLNIIFSIIGFDGYLSNGNVSTFYVLGEWFLGFIIIIYIVFPLLRYGVLKHPFITAGIALVLYSMILLYYDFLFPQHMVLFTRLPEILFGMYFVKYIKKVNWKMTVISMTIIILNTITASQNIHQDIQTTYVGISAFIVLYYLGTFVQKRRFIVYSCKEVCKYSYAIFLVHHYIIALMMGEFDLNAITILESWLLFILICGVILFFSKLLYESNKCVLKYVHHLIGDKS